MAGARLLTPTHHVHLFPHRRTAFKQAVAAMDEGFCESVPLLWAPAAGSSSAGSSSPLLLPVCQHYDCMHEVQGSGAVELHVRNKLASLTAAEKDFLVLGKAAVLLHRHEPEAAGELPSVAPAPADLRQLLAVLDVLYEQLGKPLSPVWQPNATAPRWVCSNHLHLYRRLPTSLNGRKDRSISTHCAHARRAQRLVVEVLGQAAAECVNLANVKCHFCQGAGGGTGDSCCFDLQPSLTSPPQAGQAVAYQGTQLGNVAPLLRTGRPMRAGEVPLGGSTVGMPPDAPTYPGHSAEMIAMYPFLSTSVEAIEWHR